MWNKRELVARLADAIEQLAKHGPARPDDQRAVDDVRRRRAHVLARRFSMLCASVVLPLLMSKHTRAGPPSRRRRLL